MSIREQILAATDFDVETVDVPKWGVSVRVRTLTAAQRDQFEAGLTGDGRGNLGNIRARLVCLCVVDDDGRRVFSDEDAHLLGTKSGLEVDKVFQVARRLNGMSAAAVEELEKNSPPAPSDASPSA
jgi:hypothetical protein